MSVYIIAEIGVNHDGNLDKAHKLIDAAADAGADAVKFQTYRADELAVAGPHRDMLAKYQMPLEWYPKLKRHAKKVGLDFSSSVFDVRSVKFLAKLGVPWIKIPSGENDNYKLVKAVKKLGIKSIISDGLGGMSDDVIGLLRSNDAVLSCVSNYPAKVKDYRLRSKSMQQNLLGYCYEGFSDHTLGNELGIMAAALKMEVFEKHFTLDRFDEGPDHHMSCTPREFKDLVKSMRSVEKIIQDGEYQKKNCDKKTIPRARRVQTPEGFKRNP